MGMVWLPMSVSVFVTGSSGMLGFEVLKHLSATPDYRATGITRRPLAGASATLVSRLVEAPLNPGWLQADERGGTIVHCAGLSNPRRSFADLAELEAQEIAPHIAFVQGLAHQGWHGHLVYLSSGGTVYGDADHLPIPETAPLRPKGHYAISKVRIERGLTDLAAEHGFSATILRVANPYGAAIRKAEQGVIPHLIAAARSGQGFVMIGTGDEVRDYLHISDFNRAVERAVALPPPGGSTQVLNIGSGRGTALRRLVDLVGEITGRTIRVERRPSTVDVRSNLLDITKAGQVLGWTPRFGIEAGLRSLIAEGA